jgi:hypothetical protein
LVVEFAIIEKDPDSDKIYSQNGLYLAQSGEPIEKCRYARIKIEEKGHMFVEFQINGEIKEALVF